MRKSRLLCLATALCCLLTLGGATLAAEVECDAQYCFSAGDFSQEEALRGICITGLPAPETGTVMLDNRVLRTGDILTEGQISQMVFCPLWAEADTQATVTYLPIFENRVAPTATMTIAIKGKKDNAPVAEDFTLETYKNLPAQGKLKVSDPEEQSMTYTLVRAPKRGEVTIHSDGTFTYTPKKNKVGVDSFTYTAADPAGNVSREATATIQILKPTDSRQYTDTAADVCRFSAEWLRNTGLFVGEQVAGADCFYPEKEVSRGEFLSMVINLLDIPTQAVSLESVPADTPQWLKPYLAAALRSGLTAGLPESEDGSFQADAPITGAEAAVMLQNALDLSISQQTLETQEAMAQDENEAVPAWAAVSMTAMNDHGITQLTTEPMTRSQMAQVLYQVSQLALDAPGMQVIRMQQ